MKSVDRSGGVASFPSAMYGTRINYEIVWGTGAVFIPSCGTPPIGRTALLGSQWEEMMRNPAFFGVYHKFEISAPIGLLPGNMDYRAR